MSGQEIAGAWAFINSGAVLTMGTVLLRYIVTNERRITKLETIIQLLSERKG